MPSEQSVNKTWREMILAACKDDQTRIAILEGMRECVQGELAECESEDEAAYRSEIEFYNQEIEKLNPTD